MTIEIAFYVLQWDRLAVRYLRSYIFFCFVLKPTDDDGELCRWYGPIQGTFINNIGDASIGL